jgi:fucose 4-O-acetylase-like acetyltransferase
MQKQSCVIPLASAFSAEVKQDLSTILFSIRGFAIVLVIVGHVIGESHSGIRQLYSEDLPQLSELRRFIYTFHMPIFFIASGIAFAVFSYSKGDNLRQFVSSRLSRLVMPLLCWAPLYYGLSCLVDQTHFRLADLVKAVIYPDFIFWFFHSLLPISLFSYLVLRHSSIALYGGISTVLFAVSFLADGDIPRTLYFNLFYALGFLLGVKLKQTQELPFIKFKLIAILAASGLAFLAMLLIFFWIGDSHYSLTKFINGLLGFLLLYLISLTIKPNHLQDDLKMHREMDQGTCRDYIARGLVYLGRISMSIYLLHIIFGSAARMVLVKLGILAPGWQFTLGCLVALLGTVVTDALLRPYRIFLVSIGEAK